MAYPGERIRQRRKALGLSQSELAERLGYRDRSTVAKLESGINDVSQAKLQAYAAVLETTPAYLMGLTDAPDAVTAEDELKFALFGGAEEITDEMYAEVLEYARYVRERERRKQRG